MRNSTRTPLTATPDTASRPQGAGGEAALGNTANNSGEITTFGRRRRYELREKARKFADRTLVPRRGHTTWEDQTSREGDVTETRFDTVEIALWPKEDRMLACGARSRRRDGSVTVVADNGRAGYKNLQACGSVWACPVCSGKIQRFRAVELGGVLVWARREGHTIALVTLTVRHKKRQPLRNVEDYADPRTGEFLPDDKRARGVWDAISAGWSAVTSGKEWGSESVDKYEERLAMWEARLADAMAGVPGARYPRRKKVVQDPAHLFAQAVLDSYEGAVPRGVLLSYTDARPSRRIGQAEANGVLGWARAVEATVSDRNGWHVHVHAVLVIQAQNSDQGVRRAYRAGRGMFDRWQSGIATLGFDADPDNGGLDITVASAAEKKLAEYLAKDGLDFDSAEGEHLRNSFDKQARGVANETTMGSNKNGRKGRTPFQVLEAIDFDNAPETSGRDLAIWREWVEGSHGRQQLTWSKSLRVLAGLAEEAKTDQEIVDEADPGKDALRMPDATWKAVRRTSWKILESVELNGVAATVADLRARGLEAWEVDWDDPFEEGDPDEWCPPLFE